MLLLLPILPHRRTQVHIHPYVKAATICPLLLNPYITPPPFHTNFLNHGYSAIADYSQSRI